MADSRPRPRRSVLITARVIALIVGLAGAEGMLWFGGYPRWWAMEAKWGGAAPEYQCDPDLGWSLREGKFDLVWSDHPQVARYTNWSGGRRATSSQQPMSQTVKRSQVMFFGDSFIQGYEISDNETLPWIVQARHPELEVSNFGGGNFGTYQSYLAMKRWVHGPVSAYYLFNGFHEDRNAADPNWLRVNHEAPAGCFYPYAEISSGELKQHKSSGNVVWWLSHHLRIVALVEDYRDIFESYFRVHNKRALTEALLVKMDQIARGRGGKFTVILFDMSEAERKDYRSFLESQGIAYVDCDKPQMGDKSLRLPDGHPSGGLNNLLATWIEPIPVVEPQIPSARTASR